MPGAEVLGAKADGAADAVARAMAGCPPEARPLAVIDGADMRRAVLSHRALSGRIGARAVSPNALRTAASLGAGGGTTALLASLDGDNSALRRSAARTRLLARVYRHIRELELRNPVALSSMFRDALDGLDSADPEGLDRDAIAAEHGRHQVELETLLGLWDALCADGHASRRKTLGELAASLDGPVVYMHWDRPLPWVVDFLGAAAGSGSGATRIEASLDDRSEALDALWRGEGGKTPRGGGAFSAPLLYNSGSIEEAAEAALAIVGKWRAELGGDERSIGLVGYDRLLVRRVHSLFLQHGLHIRDGSGWLARNLLVGRALLAAAAAPDTAAELAARLRQVMAHGGGDMWWKLPRRLAERRDAASAELEALLESTSARDERAADWFARLAELTERRPLAGFFDGDPAGENIRRLLRLMADEFDGADAAGMGLREVRGLLLDALGETNLFSDVADSPVELVPPAGFSTRRFDALLLLGADENTLPRTPPPGFFGAEVLEALGLETPDGEIARHRRASALRLSRHDRLAAVWSGPSYASPYLDLMGPRSFEALGRQWERKRASGAERGHGTALRELPPRISPSSFTTLLRCPYRYHSQSVLRLEEDPKDPLGRADIYGSFVHEVLARFHLAVMEDPEIDLSAELSRLTELAARGELPEIDSGGRSDLSSQPAEALRTGAWAWSHAAEEYVDRIRDLLGSRGFKGFDAVEKRFETEIAVDGRAVTVSGICDRLDAREIGGKRVVSVVDIKTGSKQGYSNHLEHPQLPMYVAMSKTFSGCDHAGYWGLNLEKGRIESWSVDLDESGAVLARSILGDIEDILGEAMGGAPLPANGTADYCEHCPYGGLCRREHWAKEAAPAQ